MKLIQINNNQVELAEGTLLIPEFSELWNKYKEDVTINILKFIYLYADFNSPYKEYKESDRKDVLLKQFNLEYTDELDNLVKVYKDLTYSFTMKYCDSALNAASKNMGYWDNVDYSEKDAKGNFVYSITEVQRSLGDCLKVVTAIEALKEKIKTEQIGQNKIRGGGEATDFEQ